MSTERQNIVGSLGGVTFHNPGAFWFAVVASSVGVLLHLPMYIGGRDMGYRLAGMPVDTPMLVGMFLITVGLIAAIYGLYPPSAEATAGRVSRIRVRALDDAPMRPAHVGLLVVMAIAVTIDVMKPTTLAFVVPGMAQEYGLRSPLNPGGRCRWRFSRCPGSPGRSSARFCGGGWAIGSAAAPRSCWQGSYSYRRRSAAPCPTTSGTS